MAEMKAARRLALVRVVLNSDEPIDMLAIHVAMNRVAEIGQVANYLSELERKALIDVVDQAGVSGLTRYRANDGTSALAKLLEQTVA